ncbi:MAG: PIN domain-containing protein [Melioribacteraceae bacterium]|nr:PIN domain-containing protein [Melioribacteraceae bacterium]
MNKFLFDTNLFIYFLNGNNISKVIFENILSNDGIISYSFITKLELFSFDRLLSDDEFAINQLLNEFKRVDYNFIIEGLTITIRKKKKIKIPDAIIAASAIYTNSTLVTRNTKDFKNIEGF